ncbi:adenylosuccinate lyase [Candidatus Kaiserbacteria bacterium]|nr:adenylosuccinate lyase [Candidatus Kaiserbacteria bacterium]
MKKAQNSTIFEPLTAISSVDGRYREAVEELAEYFSEYALIRARLFVECTYLLALSDIKALGVRHLTPSEKGVLEKLWKISLDDASVIKKIEKEGYEGIPPTNHDVKAIEYYLKLKLKGTSLEDIAEWAHFGLTSEDVNSIAYALCLRGALQEVALPALDAIRSTLDKFAKEFASTPMLSRTHGQPASPTTFGKEMRVFEARLARQLEQLSSRSILVKCGGATGNWNAHMAAAGDVDWLDFMKKFVDSFNSTKKHIQLQLNAATTQIEPHDTYAELFDNLRRINTILVDFSQDMWRYVSDGWIGQNVKEGEVGSSTMPHKVNPIDFENAEGNLGVANALFEHFSRKLPISRLQRDLSDSTVERAFGTAFAHSLVGYKALSRGLSKVRVDNEAMLSDLQKHPEVIAEAIQTVLRREGVEVPYERLKVLTRGREVSLDDFATFIDTLDIHADLKNKLKALRPENYVGLAEKIARR